MRNGVKQLKKMDVERLRKADPQTLESVDALSAD